MKMNFRFFQKLREDSNDRNLPRWKMNADQLTEYVLTEDEKALQTLLKDCRMTAIGMGAAMYGIASHDPHLVNVGFAGAFIGLGRILKVFHTNLKEYAEEEKQEKLLEMRKQYGIIREDRPATDSSSADNENTLYIITGMPRQYKPAPLV